jgi:CRISPR-associated exonuclease Cas4
LAVDHISASEIERYGYCPLSWWLSRTERVDSEELREGSRRHAEISDGLHEIVLIRKMMGGWGTVSVLASSMATAIALIGLTLLPISNAEAWSQVFTLFSIPWVLVAVYLFYRTASIKEGGRLARYERGAMGSAILAIILATNSVTVLGVDVELAMIYEAIAMAWLLVACVAVALHMGLQDRLKERKTGLAIDGEVSYVGDEIYPVLRSDRYGLSGRPDYIIRTGEGSVPVEVKTGRVPQGPHFSHILQVAAYCLILSDVEGRRPTYGILRYGDVEHEIEFDTDLEGLLLSKVDEMRGIIRSGEAHRNHERNGKCRSCSRRSICPERLI